jgi:hypothetical protein
MNRAAATLPNDSHVPICGFPARNARITGFFFNVLSYPGKASFYATQSSNKSVARTGRRSKFQRGVNEVDPFWTAVTPPAASTDRDTVG